VLKKKSEKRERMREEDEQEIGLSLLTMRNRRMMSRFAATFAADASSSPVLIIALLVISIKNLKNSVSTTTIVTVPVSLLISS
jgi:hypothetical protein